jgi:glycosyltransferase involved in cell wall biosynthesis
MTGGETVARRLVVVVPALDEAARIRALVERLLRGDAGEFSRREPTDRADLVIVVDGGSRDGTVELARRAGALVIDSACGRGAQLQAGALWALESEGLADEDLLLFVHADNRPADGALAALRRAADAGAPRGVVALACRQAVDAQGAFYRAVENLADKRVAQRGLVYGDSSLCLTAGVYREAGGFRPLPLFEDVDLSRRLRRLGKVQLVPDAAVHVCPRRWQREGATLTVVRNWIVTRAYWLGLPPRWCAKLYPRHRSS